MSSEDAQKKDKKVKTEKKVRTEKASDSAPGEIAKKEKKSKKEKNPCMATGEIDEKEEEEKKEKKEEKKKKDNKPKQGAQHLHDVVILGDADAIANSQKAVVSVADIEASEKLKSPFIAFCTPEEARALREERAHLRALAAARKAVRPLKKPEDNIEISEYRSDSEVECENPLEPKRSPDWCDGWQQKVSQQAVFDPDTIFGSRVPNLNMWRIFGKNRLEAYHARCIRDGIGSDSDREGDENDFDPLTRGEMNRQKEKLGQIRPWKLSYRRLSAV